MKMIMFIKINIDASFRQYRHVIFAISFIVAFNTEQVTASDAVLSVTAPVITASCDISIPQSVIGLGTFITDDFTDNNGTALVRNFQVKIDNCGGDNLYMHPALKVYGDHLAKNPYVFGSQTYNSIGFMIRAEKYSGSLASFYDTNVNTVVKDDALSYDNDARLLKEGGIDYTVGLVAPGLAPGGDGTAPSIGDVKASVTFEYLYH